MREGIADVYPFSPSVPDGSTHAPGGESDRVVEVEVDGREAQRGRPRVVRLPVAVVPPRTLSHQALKRIVEIQRTALQREGLELTHARPKTRAECEMGPRPCPYVSCSQHLYLDVNDDTGAIKLNFPGLEVDELAETCALDVADWGGETLSGIGELMNITRERVRQIEAQASRRKDVKKALAQFAPPDRER